MKLPINVNYNRACLVLAVCSMVLVRMAAADGLDDLSLNESNRRILTRYLDEASRGQVAWALGTVDQTTLGPQPLTDEQQRALSGPERRVRLKIGEDVPGTGTADDPFVGAIEAFLETLGEEPREVTVLVPSAYYRELKLNLPPGLWLRAESGATIVAPPTTGAEETSYIVSPGRSGGIVGFEIDGSTAPERIDGIRVARDGDQAVVARNRLHHITGLGVGTLGGARHGARGVQVMANEMRYLGDSGVRLGKEWAVEHNDIRYAGILRVGGMGGGGDGIITHGRARGGKILNNHVVTSRHPVTAEVFSVERDENHNAARHAIATQKAERITIRGNGMVVEGNARFALALADGSNQNEVIGNVLLQVRRGDEDGRARIAIVVNGAENRMAGNAILGFPHAFNINEPKRPDQIHGNETEDNYAAVTGSAVRVTGPGNPVRQNEFKENIDYWSIIRAPVKVGENGR